jgi:hypothetical protein
VPEAERGPLKQPRCGATEQCFSYKLAQSSLPGATVQSERLYQAIKGHGGVTRLVVLPHESHGYSARESVMHTLYEMDRWMETYCNGKEFEDV